MKNPLIVDLDGTLIRNDLTHDLLILCARWKPFALPSVILTLLLSKSKGKRRLLELVGDRIDPAHLPYDEKVLEIIDTARQQDRPVELISGSDDHLVKRIADHLQVFSFAKGSEPGDNLVSTRKAEYVEHRYADGFLYAGNSSQDIAVWKRSISGYGVRAPSNAYRLTDDRQQPIEVEELQPRRSELPATIKACRLHQWAKNILLFVVPALFITELGLADWFALAQGFICFGMMASGTYILNDLFDIPDDRAHATKRRRPLAAGTLSIPTAIVAMFVLVVGSLIWAFSVSQPLFYVLALYAATTISYSFRLKRLPLIDVFILASLFCLRVIAGAEIINAAPSAWLMTFVGFIFLSLALAKRYVEVSKLKTTAAIKGRGYVAQDAQFLLAFGAASAFSAIMALAVYGLLEEDRVIQSSAVLLAVAATLAAWTMRIWMMAVREQLNDDPVLFAVKDHVSLVCLAIVGGLLLSESLRPVWTNLF